MIPDEDYTELESDLIEGLGDFLEDLVNEVGDTIDEIMGG